MTTTRLDRVIRSQRLLGFANMAAALAFVSSVGISVLNFM